MRKFLIIKQAVHNDMPFIYGQEGDAYYGWANTIREAIDCMGYDLKFPDNEPFTIEYRPSQ